MKTIEICSIVFVITNTLYLCLAVYRDIIGLRSNQKELSWENDKLTLIRNIGIMRAELEQEKKLCDRYRMLHDKLCKTLNNDNQE